MVVHGPNCTGICLVSMLNTLFMDIGHVIYVWWHGLPVYGADLLVRIDNGVRSVCEAVTYQLSSPRAEHWSRFTDPRVRSGSAL